MLGRSQGTGCPESRSTHPVGVSRKRHLPGDDNTTPLACRDRRIRRADVCTHRPRVSTSDAEKVRDLVESRAAQLHLRGARRRVLAAVLQLLCGWKRITDDQIRLRQIRDAILADQGPCYDLKTIGRALGALAADGLVTYRPARGRGNHALIAIHEQFVADVKILARDSAGRVITDSVTFYEPTPLISQTTYPPTPRRSRADTDTRPTAVNVNPHEVRAVLRALPEVLQSLPATLRWRLGREIRDRLASGWLPQQILAVLTAPMPPELRRPWRLALWRLTHNMPGSGPRLAPLQRDWDRRIAEAKRRSDDESDTRWLAAVTDATDAEQREHVLRACATKFAGPGPLNPKLALAHAGRMALRQFPADSMAAALRQWTAAILTSSPATLRPVPSSARPDVRELVAPTCDNTCVACQAAPGSIRAQLPLATPVCDDCWTQLADLELLEDIAA